MATIKTMKQAKIVIDAAAELDRLIKTQKAELDRDKVDLSEWYMAHGKELGKKFRGNERGEASFVEADVFEPISVEEALKMLTKRGKADDLLKCVKLDISALREVLGADDVATLQGDPVATKVSIRLKCVEGD